MQENFRHKIKYKTHYTQKSSQRRLKCRKISDTKSSTEIITHKNKITQAAKVQEYFLHNIKNRTQYMQKNLTKAAKVQENFRHKIKYKTHYTEKSSQRRLKCRKISDTKSSTEIITHKITHTLINFKYRNLQTHTVQKTSTELHTYVQVGIETCPPPPPPPPPHTHTHTYSNA